MGSVIFFTLILLLLPLFLFLAKTKRPSKRVPPGSMGIPIIGHSLSLLQAMQADRVEELLQERIRKYGPISKLNLFGTPTVFLHGQAANKFIYTCDGNILANQQPTSVRRILGERNISELIGEDHKRVRGALVSFLKPEVLKKYVGKIDEEIREHLDLHWHGKQEVAAMPLMKTLTFNIICSLIFGIERGERRDALLELFKTLMGGLLSIPVNLPFTQFNSSLHASAKIKKILTDVIREKRVALLNHNASPHQDLITCLLSIRDEDNLSLLSDEEIRDNVIIILIAGHDSSSVLLTFLIRLLAKDPSVYAAVLHEQEEIAKSKALGEHLTWDDLIRMKYTWTVVMETLRMTPPVLCTFRKALQDIEYGGYLIPKGWQVFWAASMTHMDETIFPNPSKLDPTRFEQQPHAPPYSFVAFGGGPRICPGSEFAKIETLAMIHYLVTQFTWNLSSTDDSFGRAPTPIFNQGLPIHITAKKSNPAIQIQEGYTGITSERKGWHFVSD